MMSRACINARLAGNRSPVTLEESRIVAPLPMVLSPKSNGAEPHAANQCPSRVYHSPVSREATAYRQVLAARGDESQGHSRRHCGRTT
jgi:hypothetical protein